MSDENLAPQEREWLANPEATVREALGDTVGDGEGLDERVFDALIARAKAEAWREGHDAGWTAHYNGDDLSVYRNPYRADQIEETTDD